MSQNPRDRRFKNQNQNEGWLNTGTAAAAGLATVATVAGGALYWLLSGSKKTEPAQEMPQTAQPRGKPPPQPTSSGGSTISSLVNLLSDLSSSSSSSAPYYKSGKVGKKPPDSPCINNLNALLADIHVRFIQLRDDDFQLHYNVFDKVFQHLHAKMMEVDLYYNKYNSTRQFAGSHYDNLRIKKPDEFDMDIVIRLPLNLSESSNPKESDIRIEPQAAGYVHLKMGVQFQKLHMRDGDEWQNNKEAYKWMDESSYLLRSKFMDWWKSVVNKALNKFQQRVTPKGNIPLFYVDGVEYEIYKSESGPAMTLFIENRRRGFKLDVDLVPALKFPENRWPITNYYRQIPRKCCKNTWMVVGKPNKAAPPHEQDRSWRIALHNQERELMHDSYHLRQAVRLLKKLRDEQGMKKIASYYIKTLFFWEIVEQNNDAFWRQNPAILFKHMVKKLHTALVNKNIPYFWNRRNNLIGNIDSRILLEYAAKLVPLMQVLDNPSGDNYKLVAKYLLSSEEYKKYYEKFLSARM